jgi:hypothetical protein
MQIKNSKINLVIHLVNQIITQMLIYSIKIIIIQIIIIWMSISKINLVIHLVNQIITQILI